MKTKDTILNLAFQLGIYNRIQALFPGTLTVLNYHRIVDPLGDGFSTFKPNVSASPAMFDIQMKYLTENYNVVSASDVIAWITEGHPLPPRAALITFDDGYSDNYFNAFPIIRKHNLPAIIFLASNYMESSTPFYWDLVAYCFYKSRIDYVEVPSVGAFSWSDENSRDTVARQIIKTLKTMPEMIKNKLTDSLPELMKVSISNEILFENMFMSWAQAREMSAHGIEMGAHTASHPILTRIPPDEANSEILNSKKRIEEAINKPVHSFAYPNGQRSDYNNVVIKSVINSGLRAAYTLLPGPTRFDTVRKHPYQIRRIFLSYKDSLPRFAGKLSGISRIFS